MMDDKGRRSQRGATLHDRALKDVGDLLSQAYGLENLIGVDSEVGG